MVKKQYGAILLIQRNDGIIVNHLIAKIEEEEGEEEEEEEEEEEKVSLSQLHLQCQKNH